MCNQDVIGKEVDNSQTGVNCDHVAESSDVNESFKESVGIRLDSKVNEEDKNEILQDNKLNLILTEINEEGIEVVIFDEEIVSEGSKKWELTVCGYFVGYKMSYQELRYNLFRMWGKFGLKSIISNGNGVFLFKFRSNEAEPNKLPLWVRLRNLPLEAWTTKGISAVASRLGTPQIMDQTTAQMCKVGYVRIGFARVLIDVEAEKRLPDKIEIIYKNRDGMVTAKKSVDVSYDWSPHVCSFCKVFGHHDKNCVIRPKSVEEFMEMEREEEKKKQNKEEFEQVRFKRKGGKKMNQNGVNKNDNKSSSTIFYKPVVKEGTNVGEGIRNEVEKEKMIYKGSLKIGWNVQHDIIHSIRKSVNKFAILEEENEIGNQFRGGIEKERESIDVYEETSSSAKKMAQNEIGSSYVEVLNGIDGGGDLNVSLNLEDHSEGISCMTQDMEEFRDCTNVLKMEDICSSGLHYTWIKSLLNLKSSVLKKIDKVTGNEEFFKEYLRAHVVFLPYGISDHSPAVLTSPKTIKAKSRSFRFANYIADKDDFLMWNLFENVKKIKKELDEVQIKIDDAPTNIQLREQSVKLFKDYSLALEDEEKILLQKTKVEWLKEGDRNSPYFHKVLKGRSNRSRVEEICGEDNVRYTGDLVPIQFVKHFQMFLGEQSNKECSDLDDTMFSNKIDNQESCRMINVVTDVSLCSVPGQIELRGTDTSYLLDGYGVLRERLTVDHSTIFHQKYHSNRAAEAHIHGRNDGIDMCVRSHPHSNLTNG
ncbi:RNA-directed DNA polymerase, eukaryota, reverse transcriptase zinc-binding domain protein [Tanacetum coccineum]